jgi:hypothetical protein
VSIDDLRFVVRTRQPLVSFDALQQVADLDVGVAVVAVAHLAALAEERIGFVEEQQDAAFFRGVEDLLQVLLGLADVLAHHRRQVDPIEIEPQARRPALRPPSSCPCR